MIVTRTIEETRRIIGESGKKVVGLVPTMGYFHDGHIEIMRQARKECEFVLTSIFVNPSQFSPDEDFKDYPRDFERDREVAEAENMDVLFAPETSEMYGAGYDTWVDPGKAAAILCGTVRPGHFRGVATVVLKLFNIVKPAKAYFGMKDAQQLRIIEKMAADLDLGVEIVPVPTVREQGGLAMSSRNSYLTPEEKKQAEAIHQGLRRAHDAFNKGERTSDTLIRIIEHALEKVGIDEVDYVSVVDWKDFVEVNTVERDSLLAVACRVGKARLIDNEFLELTPRD
jgi:pantoate--beta-alanine ligase